MSDTDRLEAFSDGVFSVTITLLLFEVSRPQYEQGHLLIELGRRWPTYLAFLASFIYVGVIWLNHHALFSRVRFADRGLKLRNLFLLLTSALIPFPTAVLSTALETGNRFDETVAVVLYAAVGAVMCLSWVILFHRLCTHRRLVESDVERAFFPRERLRAWIGVVLYACAGAIGLLAPLLSLVVFLALPIFYGLTSEGLKTRPSE